MTINHLFVQYGCGFSPAKEWVNFDSSPTLRFERLPIIGKIYTKNVIRFPSEVKYGDIVKGLPIKPGSCSAVYCSHVLEHLALNEFKVALKNTHKILKNGGFFRMVLPDLEYLINQYLNKSESEAALQFMKDTHLGIEYRSKGMKEFVKLFFGNSQHLWMWDFKSLKVELENAGFINIRRAEYLDSELSAFLNVENEDRWLNCLGVECKK